MWKKFLAAGLAAATLAGCGSGGESTPAPQPAVTSAPVPSSAPAPEENPTRGGEGGLRIAIVTSPSTVEDGSFNQDSYEGILAFIQEYPDASVTAVQEPTGEAEASVQAVAQLAASYDVVVTPGTQFAGVGTVAQEYPDTDFILVDTFPTDAQGQEVALDNLYAMRFAGQESGFFAGVAAALETVTNQVAVVTGIAYPANVDCQYGFEAGVNYANAHYGTAAQLVELPAYAGTDRTGANVGGNYIGSFNDASGGRMVGDALISAGCDILFVAAGHAGTGVFEAAKESGSVKVIGCDVDQYSQGETETGNIVLTSALKVMGPNVQRVLESIQEGSFQGENVLLGADTGSTGYVHAEGRHQLSEETLACLEEVYMLVQDGAIVPPGNFSEGNTPESFPGLD